MRKDRGMHMGKVEEKTGHARGCWEGQGTGRECRGWEEMQGVTSVVEGDTCFGFCMALIN